jgi:putative sigma-54 modulation protein
MLSLAINDKGSLKMQISIRTRAIEVTDELRDLVARRLEHALDTFKGRIETASVYLTDMNGPRRGVDKLCQITVRVQGIGDLVILERGLTVAGALSRAAGRAKYRVSEELRRTIRPSSDSIRFGPAVA